MKRAKTNRVLAHAVSAAQLAAGNIDSARTLLADFLVSGTTSLTEVQKATLHAVDKVLAAAQTNADTAARCAASQNVRGTR